MTITFDRNLFTQVNLDSGSLTMLGTITRSFTEPGEYRGSVHQKDGPSSVFYLSVDKNSPAAQVAIDLATLGDKQPDADSCCEDTPSPRFTVNPRGYVSFHVSQGRGGFDVHLRRTVEDPDERVFNSQELGEGDIFSAVIIRPGRYELRNHMTQARAEFSVAYPERGETAYRPPEPLRVQVGERIEPEPGEVKPGQGLIFEATGPTRLIIELREPDDGPDERPEQPTRGLWRNSPPAVNKTRT